MKQLRLGPNKKISGVCSGLAEYFDLEVKQVRRAMMFLTILGPGFLIYISLKIALKRTQKT